MLSEKTCVACRRTIDEIARTCPFCGSDPETGKKIDVKPLIESHFPPPPELSAHERVAEFLRTRQTVSVAIFVLVAVGALVAAHRWIQQRNETAVAPTPGVTLTEIADLSRQVEEREPLPLPELPFDGDGDPKRMQTFVLEPGAIAPPPEPTEQPTSSAASPTSPSAPGGAPSQPARPASAAASTRPATPQPAVPPQNQPQ